MGAIVLCVVWVVCVSSSVGSTFYIAVCCIVPCLRAVPVLCNRR